MVGKKPPANNAGRGPLPQPPSPPADAPHHMPPELLEYLRQQQNDALFRQRLWTTVKRWAMAALAVLLAATSGVDAVQKLIAAFKALP